MQALRFRHFGLYAAVAILCAIPLSIEFADRPIATFMYQHMHETRRPFIALSHLVDALELLAAAGLVWSGWNFSRGKGFGEYGGIAVRTALALFSAIGVKDVLKLAFGRTWPETWICHNPSFIRDGVFGFSPFHGGAGWGSFPSGHETLTCAVAGCLWALLPRLRPLYLVMALLVAFCLLVADFHWLSDILSGGLLGWMVGLFVARIDLAKTALPRNDGALK